MKTFFILTAAALLLTANTKSQAAEGKLNLPFSNLFCAAETQHTGLICSEIRFAYRGGQAFCESWANQMNLPLLKVFYNRNRKSLVEKQAEVCSSLEGNKGKWACLIIEDCGTTSSIGPIDKIIFSLSGDVEAARDKCVDSGWLKYKNALKAVNHGCKIAPDAIEMMH